PISSIPASRSQAAAPGGCATTGVTMPTRIADSPPRQENVLSQTPRETVRRPLAGTPRLTWPYLGVPRTPSGCYIAGDQNSFQSCAGRCDERGRHHRPSRRRGGGARSGRATRVAAVDDRADDPDP